jgi:hypothetical protein
VTIASQRKLHNVFRIGVLLDIIAAVYKLHRTAAVRQIVALRQMLRRFCHDPTVDMGEAKTANQSTA